MIDKLEQENQNLLIELEKHKATVKSSLENESLVKQLKNEVQELNSLVIY
jgi:hypothetical protein